MKIVRLTKDIRPWRCGQDAVLPDGLAIDLVDSGDAEDMRPFPPDDVAARSSDAQPSPTLREKLHLPKKYVTR